ncbi:MAG: phosphoheptose isomerase [Acidobacteria bacterium]|nr:phosphoheptose isomerase [Acidobacteriota bacterium]
MAAFRIEPRFVERVWGSTDLSPLYGAVGVRIGEVWFDAGPLLIKFLFTTAPLSVQVHPDDTYAHEHEHSRGKTEMWHILRADPGSWVWLGFKDPVTRGEAEAAVRDGSITGLLGEFHPQAGDTYFTPAGVVHALGPGLVLCEIQQNSDVTYRLYDYGRDRPLHVDRGLAVSKFEPFPGAAAPVPLGPGGERLAACPYFVTDRWTVSGSRRFQGPAVWIATGGSGIMEGQPFRPGEVFECPDGAVIESAGGATLLRTHVP